MGGHGHLRPCLMASAGLGNLFGVGSDVWSRFAGHLGDATVEHAAYHMPIIVRQFLEEITRKHRGRAVPPPLIADVFSSAIQAFDDAIANDVLELFPGGLGAVMKMPDEAIYAILNDHATGGENFKKARLCMYGTTALVALVDPEHENLWLANLGDCQGGGCISFALVTGWLMSL